MKSSTKARNKHGQFVSMKHRVLGVASLVALTLTPSLFFANQQEEYRTPYAEGKGPQFVIEARAKEPTPTVKPNYTEGRLDKGTQDVWIGVYADKFENKSIGKTASLLRYQMHCLAYKENGHSANNNCGDKGNACGMYQFWEDTWKRMRGQMMSKGLITEIGSRWNDQQAIETVAWALVNGREKEWGPILRGGCL